MNDLAKALKKIASRLEMAADDARSDDPITAKAQAEIARHNLSRLIDNWPSAADAPATTEG